MLDLRSLLCSGVVDIEQAEDDELYGVDFDHLVHLLDLLGSEALLESGFFDLVVKGVDLDDLEVRHVQAVFQNDD